MKVEKRNPSEVKSIDKFKDRSLVEVVNNRSLDGHIFLTNLDGAIDLNTGEFYLDEALENIQGMIFREGEQVVLTQD